MTKFELILLITWLLFTLVCLLFCLEARLRYQSKRGIDAEADFGGRYKYFVQTIYANEQPVGYELLLREVDPTTGKWHLPANVAAFPLSMVIAAVEEVPPRLTEQTKQLGLNLTVTQLTDFRAGYFFSWLLGVTGRVEIDIEIGAQELLAANPVQRWVIRRLMTSQRGKRLKFTIEDVDSSRQQYRKLRPFLAATDYLKFNATAFNKSANHWIDVTLAQWQRRLADYEVEPIVGKVEEEGQMALADQLKIDYRQGYGYGKPRDLAE